MEKNGIGTDASIPQHIANIVDRQYVVLGDGRTMRPTQLGTLLARGYHKIDTDLVEPGLRAYMESSCDLIAKGKTDKDTVVNHLIDVFLAKFQYFGKKFHKMDSMFDNVYNNPKKQKGGTMFSTYVCVFCVFFFCCLCL